MKFVFKIFNIFKTSFHMKHVKLGTSETIVDQNAAIPTLDSDARAIVLVVHQNAIFRLVAGKKVIHGYSVYFCVCWTKEVFLRVVFFFSLSKYFFRMNFSGFACKVNSNFYWWWWYYMIYLYKHYFVRRKKYFVRNSKLILLLKH